jgi:NAD(P)-dependent dehydrogenase (short-subunit alcohol dehydrogenase family)
MREIIITGASRGIGRALAVELGKRTNTRLFLVARDSAAIEEVARQCRDAQAVTGDLSSVSRATELGAELAARLESRAILVHNAGLWPAKRELTAEGFERAYAVNHAGPSAFQAPLLAAGKLSRVMVVSAGMIAVGKFDPARTPSGLDFSSFRTYANTKRHFAETTRSLAADYPDVDFLVLHPGVVRTELGARAGLFGALLELAKRRWEAPEVCAARLARILEIPRWSAPGQASWYVEETPMSWPV